MADTYDYNTIDVMQMLQSDEIKITDQAESSFKDATNQSVKKEEKEMLHQFKELQQITNQKYVNIIDKYKQIIANYQADQSQENENQKHQTQLI